jgi:protease IV
MSFIKKIVVRFLVMIGILTIIIMISSMFILKSVLSMKKSIDDNTLLHLNISSINGDVTTDSGFFMFEGMFGNKVSLIDAIQLINKAAEDKKIVGLFADASMVSLSFSQVEELRKAVEGFRKSGKPAYAWSDSFGEIENGTKNYYLTSSFDKIYAQHSGMLGFTGLASGAVFLKGTLDKLDIEPIGSNRKEYKTYWNMFTEEKFTEAHKESTRSMIDSIFGKVAADISVSRDIPVEKIYEIADGMPMTSEETLKQGLIDGIKYRDEVLNLLKTETGYEKRCSISFYRDVVSSDLKKGEAKIALIEIPGTIHRGASDIGPSGYHQSSGSSTISGMIKRAAKDELVKGIILRVNSPGGSVIASETIWNEINELVKKNEKPVIVSMGSVAASGGYYVSMSAEKIFANHMTVTGSIGVVLGKLYTEQFFKKMGITFDYVSTGKNTMIFSSTTRLTPEQKNYVEKSLDDIYVSFVDRAAQGRKMDYEEMEKHAKGRVWTGAQAKERNLVDETGGFQEAFDYIKSRVPDVEEFTLVKYPEPERFIAMLLGGDDTIQGRTGFFSRIFDSFNRLISAYFQIQRVISPSDDELIRLESNEASVR